MNMQVNGIILKTYDQEDWTKEMYEEYMKENNIKFSYRGYIGNDQAGFKKEKYDIEGEIKDIQDFYEDMYSAEFTNGGIEFWDKIKSGEFGEEIIIK